MTLSSRGTLPRCGSVYEAEARIVKSGLALAVHPCLMRLGACGLFQATFSLSHRSDTTQKPGVFPVTAPDTSRIERHGKPCPCENGKPPEGLSRFRSALDVPSAAADFKTLVGCPYSQRGVPGPILQVPAMHD